MAKVEVFRNIATGVEWAANPGSEAHKRMVAGVARGEFERVQKRRSTRKSDDED